MTEYEGLPMPWPPEELTRAVDRLIGRLHKSVEGESIEPVRGATEAAAILGALSAREVSAQTTMAADALIIQLRTVSDRLRSTAVGLGDKIEDLATIVGASETRLSGQIKHASDDFQRIASSGLLVELSKLVLRIDDLTTKSDKGTNRLAFWTGVLAGATIGLVFATGSLVAVEWLKPEPPTPIVVTAAPPPPAPIVITPMPPPDQTPPKINNKKP